jgi:hypothetical protein
MVVVPALRANTPLLKSGSARAQEMQLRGHLEHHLHPGGYSAPRRRLSLAPAGFGAGAKRVTDKALASFMLLGIVHRVFPNATLIHCRRNPIDTALSIYCTNFETNLDFAANRSDLVFFFRQYQRLMAHWREVLPPDRFVEVDYEDWSPIQNAMQDASSPPAAWSGATRAWSRIATHVGSERRVSGRRVNRSTAPRLSDGGATSPGSANSAS